MAGRAELEPSAHYRAAHRGDHRHPAVLDAIHDAVPAARMRHDVERSPGRMLAPVAARGEMTAGAAEHDGANLSGYGDKEAVEGLDQRIVEGIALFGTIEDEVRHLALLSNPKNLLELRHCLP